MTSTIKLGGQQFEVIDQPHALLTHDLPVVVQRIVDGWEGLDIDDVDGWRNLPMEAMYDLLCVFLPDLEEKFPKHKFAGFPTKAAWEAGEFDRESARQAPSFPQVAAALEVCLDVNGRDTVARMLGWVDPKVRALAWAWVRMKLASRLESSPSSPRTSGASAPTSSGGAALPATETTAESPSLV